jgi:hypothetical protein
VFYIRISIAQCHSDSSGRGNSNNKWPAPFLWRTNTYEPSVILAEAPVAQGIDKIVGRKLNQGKQLEKV